MSNLHEQYETLRRRGCPEHPRLRRRVPPWWTLTDSLELDDPRHVRGGDTIHPDDARDLLAAHVRRWLASLRSDSPKIYKPEIAVNWYEHDDIVNIEMTRVKGNRVSFEDGADNIHYGSSYFGMTPEAALIQFAIEATEHLEPGKP